MFIHAHPTEASSKKSKTCVLVHSAQLGAWEWQQVAKSLEAAGHTVITPDLAGHGSDKTPESEITIETYVNQLIASMALQLVGWPNYVQKKMIDQFI